jgi:hypothetical protein
MPRNEGHLLVQQMGKKADIEYPFEDGEGSNNTLDGVSIHPVTTKIHRSFLTLRGRKLLRAFTKISYRVKWL